MAAEEEFSKRIQNLRELAKEEAKLGEKVNENLGELLSGYTKLVKLKKDQYNAEILLQNTQQKYKELLKEVVRINASGTEEEKKKLPVLDEQLGLLSAQAAELEKSIQKAKLFGSSLKNATDFSKALTGSISNGIGGALKGLASISGIPTSLSELQRAISSSLSNMNNLDKSIRTLVVNFGGGTYANETFRKSLQSGASDAVFLGAALEDLINVQAALGDKLGRNLLLGSNQFAEVSAIARGTSLGFEQSAELLEKYQSFGIGITNTYERLDKFTQNLQKTGLSTGKVLQTLSTNLKTAQAYNFREGIQGLQKMVIEAQRLKFDVSDTFRFAEKLFTPEGAIETAAELQVLGGAFSRLADPFQLLFKARNDLAGLQNDVIQATAGIAIKVGNEFKIPALELQRLRLIAEKTGLNFNNLTESALQFAQRDYIGAQLPSAIRYNKELSNFVKDVGQLNDGVAQINVNGVMTNVNKLTKEQVIGLQGQAKSLKEIAANSQVFQDRLKQVGQTIQLAFLPLVAKFNDFFNKPQVIENLKRVAVGISDFIQKTTKPIFDILEDPQFFKGDSLAENVRTFVSTTIKAGFDIIKPLMAEAMPFIMEGIKELVVQSFDFLQGILVMKVKSMVNGMIKAIGVVAKQAVGALKFLPFIGDLISIGSAIKRFSEGDNIGGAIDLASGVLGGAANLLTGGFGGTIGKIAAKSLAPAATAGLKATSFGLDVGNAGRDLGAWGDKRQAQDLTYFPGQKPLLTIPGAGAYELSANDAIYARDTKTKSATGTLSNNINVVFSGTIRLDAGGVSKDMKMELLEGLSRDISFQRDLIRSLTANGQLTYSNLS